MERDERQFLLTTAWMFALHGQNVRSRILCEALVEDDPRDGIAAAALAERLIEDRDATTALKVLREADYPKELERAAALLETRALSMLGRKAEAERRWKRFTRANQGSERTWL